MNAYYINKCIFSKRKLWKINLSLLNIISEYKYIFIIKCLLCILCIIDHLNNQIFLILK